MITDIGYLEFKTETLKDGRKRYYAINDDANKHMIRGLKDGVYKIDDQGRPFMTESEYSYFYNYFYRR